jgi:nucleotide-binding universal stress UspA family protein
MSVLVSYVPTEVGYAALDAAILEARMRVTSLVVLNVVVGGNYAEVTAADDRDLDAVRAKLADEGVPSEVRQEPSGLDIAATVLDVAVQTDAELIVVGLHRRSLVGKMLLGSNAQRIIVDAHCPVLSVRPDEDD